MFKLTTGSVYARPFHLSFHVILITILLNSIAIKIKSNSCMLSAPTQISGISEGQILPLFSFLDTIFYILYILYILPSISSYFQISLEKHGSSSNWVDSGDIQEKSTALNKTVAGWAFADMSEMAFTAQIQDVDKNTDFLFQKSRSYRPGFRDMYKGYFQGVREFATTNESKVLQGLRCPGFSSPAVELHMAKYPVQQQHPKGMPHHRTAKCARV